MLFIKKTLELIKITEDEQKYFAIIYFLSTFFIELATYAWGVLNQITINFSLTSLLNSKSWFFNL